MRDIRIHAAISLLVAVPALTAATPAIAETRPEWSQAGLAVLAAGAVLVPIYPSSSAEECAWILRNSGARLAICGTAAQRNKVGGVPAVTWRSLAPRWIISWSSTRSESSGGAAWGAAGACGRACGCSAKIYSRTRVIIRPRWFP